MWQQANRMKELCEQVVMEEGHRKLECEVWRQQGSGSHRFVNQKSRYLVSCSSMAYRFDMMAKRLYKTYVNLTNIVVRVSDGTPEGKEHAVLVNSHLDSTLPSPGAADDALSVGVMLECIRVLVSSPGWSPKHAIVFCTCGDCLAAIYSDNFKCSTTPKNLCRTGRTCILPNTPQHLPYALPLIWKVRSAVCYAWMWLNIVHSRRLDGTGDALSGDIGGNDSSLFSRPKTIRHYSCQ